MNIFPIDINPENCAKWSCDQHVIKILTEAVEIFSSVCDVKEKYKPIKSPWVKWANNKENRNWLSYYIYHLGKEYEYRFGKKHKAFELYKNMIKELNEIPYKNIELTKPEFLQLVDDDSKCDNSIIAYRNYYKWKREHFKRPMRWTKREVPKFLKGD